MECRVSELRYKETTNVSGGSRYGWVGDVEVNLSSERVRALVVPGRLRLFNLPGREEDWIFSWETVRRFGADTVLVETPPLSHPSREN